MSDNRYLNLEEGAQKVFVTDIRHKKATNEDRATIILRIAAHPTSVSHTAPYTLVKLPIPGANEETGTKVLFEQKIKDVLYPLAGKGREEKIGLNALYQDVKATLQDSDVEVEILAKGRDGNSVDPSTGLPRKFYDIAELTPVTLLEKAAYVSDVDFEEIIED